MASLRWCRLCVSGHGHFLGLDVHDVGGSGLPVPEDKLVPGHVVTCEPGIYFVDTLLGPALADPKKAMRPPQCLSYRLSGGAVGGEEPSPYRLCGHDFCIGLQATMLNADRINKLIGMGGVRIEDNVAITHAGAVNLTRAPKARREVEEIVAKSMSFQ